MRKFLLFAMVMFTLPLFAQDFGMRLAHVYSEDGFENWDYIYPNETGTDVTCINEIDFTTDTECIDSVYYDDRGNIVKLATWQKIEGEWIYACYVEYTYDERNLKTSRTNYNHFGDKFELGGIYRYNYDEEGRMISWALEFFNLPEYQKCVIEYNEEGQKIAEIMQQYSFETYYLENSTLTEYEYDDNGNMVRSNEFYWDGAWVIKASKIKEYDEYGNCTLAEQTTSAGTVQERRIYTYDTSISSDQVFYYPNPEDDYPQLPESKNHLLKTFEYYTQNDEMSLVYVTTYIFDYEVVEIEEEEEEEEEEESGYSMRLAHIYSEDGFESWDYVYPSETGIDLTCINEIDFTTDTECIDSIYYDDRGNIVKLATWQKIEGEWIYACYVEYTYDERNLKTSRTNYNHFGDNFELGGIYRYNYDEEGKMISWALEFFNIPEFQKCVIEYNEEGQKIAEVLQNYSFETYYLENSTLTEYEYDDNGNMVRSNEFFWEDAWVIQASKVKEYDEYGNCILAEQRTDAGTVQERRIYTYDASISSDQVFYYPNPEDDYPQLPESKNHLLKTFEYYTQNDEMSLVYVTTYIFDYEVIGDVEIEDDTESVAEVAFASSVYPNPAQDFVMVESSEANYVEVVDVYGRVMFSSEMSETVKVDMNDFASGIYFVKLQANGATSVQKVIKK